MELIIKATQREKRALKGADKIALRVAKVLNKYKINKYYDLDIIDFGFTYERKQELIAQEMALDGVYNLSKIHSQSFCVGIVQFLVFTVEIVN